MGRSITLLFRISTTRLANHCWGSSPVGSMSIGSPASSWCPSQGRFLRRSLGMAPWQPSSCGRDVKLAKCNVHCSASAFNAPSLASRCMACCSTMKNYCWHCSSNAWPSSSPCQCWGMLQMSLWTVPLFLILEVMFWAALAVLKDRDELTPQGHSSSSPGPGFLGRPPKKS